MDKYMIQCIDNLSNKWKQDNITLPIHYDIVLDGGAFNGSYTLGVLLYLKELEKRDYSVIHRISGASIGSIMGVLFIANKLELGIDLYKHFFTYFKKTGSLRILKKYIHKIILNFGNEFYKKCNNKLFISYFDCKNNKQIIQSKFTNNQDLYKVIVKSTFVPFLINGKFLYKSKYIDGLYPYVFTPTTNRKRIFVDLTQNLFKMLYIKNEITNSERVIEGMLDLHYLLFNNNSKKYCSFIDDWNIIYRTYFKWRIIYTQLIIFLIHYYLKNYKNVQKNSFKNEIRKLYVKTLRIFLTNFFV